MKNIKPKKVMVTGDYHIPHIDDKAYSLMKSYAKDYKPNVFVINGDLVDFYTLSFWDKNPERKYDLITEIKQAKEILTDIRKTVGNKCEIYYLNANHEVRLRRYLSKQAPELYALDELKIQNLFGLKNNDIKFIDADEDYWKQTNGHLKISDMVIMHGDNRLNGASTSKYSGYSVKNTILNGMQSNVIQNHVHRLALFHHTTAYGNYIGIEAGCLCEKVGTANWQQGFITFEYDNKGSFNHQLIHIKDDMIKTTAKIYKAK